MQPIQAAVYEDFGKSDERLSHLDAYRRIGPDHKSRLVIASRPGSTVSYSRTDAFSAMYNPSPAPDGIQARVLWDHQEAVDQFNVNLAYFSAIRIADQWLHYSV